MPPLGTPRVEVASPVPACAKATRTAALPVMRTAAAGLGPVQHLSTTTSTGVDAKDGRACVLAVLVAELRIRKSSAVLRGYRMCDCAMAVQWCATVRVCSGHVAVRACSMNEFVMAVRMCNGCAGVQSLHRGYPRQEGRSTASLLQSTCPSCSSSN